MKHRSTTLNHQPLRVRGIRGDLDTGPLTEVEKRWPPGELGRQKREEWRALRISQLAAKLRFDDKYIARSADGSWSAEVEGIAGPVQSAYVHYSARRPVCGFCGAAGGKAQYRTSQLSVTVVLDDGRRLELELSGFDFTAKRARRKGVRMALEAALHRVQL